jgi:hypothetical protein
MSRTTCKKSNHSALISLTPKQVAIKGELQDVLNHYEQFDRLAQVINGHQ